MILTPRAFLGVAIGLFALAGSEGLAQEKTTGRIQVECSNGVTIYLDGTMVGACKHNGVGPQIKGVEVGSHLVRAKKAGYVDATQRAVVFHNGTTIVNFVFTDPLVETVGFETEVTLVLERQVGALLVRAVPALPHTELVLNGEQLGDLDRLVKNVPTGKTRLTFRRSGSRPTTHELNLASGKTVEVTLDWETRAISESEIVGLLSIPSKKTGTDEGLGEEGRKPAGEETEPK